MAYKFQLGLSRMSGTLEQEGDVVVSTGSSDVIGIVNVHGASDYFAQMKYDGSSNIESAVLELVSGSQATSFYAGEKLSGSVMDTLAGTALEFDQNSGVMDFNIDGLSALGGASLHQTQDHFVFSDNGTEKKITFSNLEDSIFGNVSGDIAIAAGGAATIQANAVEGSMLNTDAISAQTEMTGDLDDTDELLVSDAGVLKRADFSVVRDAVFNDVSGQAAVAAGGALSLDVSAITAQTQMTGDVADADELMISDGGVLKSVEFSVFRDAVFNDVSGDALVAAGGALTIQANAVEGTMLNSNTAGDGLQYSSNALAVDVSDFAGTGLEDDGSENLRLSAQGTGIAGGAGSVLSIDSAQTGIASLFNTNLKLGYSATDANIDFSTDNKIIFDVDNAQVMEITSSGVVIAGNLTVQGTTTTVDSTTINISSSFTFEGPADANETILSCGAPAGDLTVMLPQYAATETIHLAALADAPTAASCDVTAAEFALLDGGSTIGTDAIASGDGFLHNDGGTMKQTSIDKIIDAAAGNGLAVDSSGIGLELDINGLSNSLSAVAQADLIALSDNSDSGATKKITFTDFEDQIFGNVSGQASIAAGGALSLDVSAITAQTDIGAAIVDTDELIISDGGALRRTDMSRVATYVGNNVSATVQTLTNASESLAVSGGPLVLANHASGMTITLDTPANHQGKRVVIKKIGAGDVTISANGSENIDGQSGDIILESPMAAVTVISDGSNYFIV